MDAASGRNQNPFRKRYPAISASELSSRRHKTLKSNNGSGGSDNIFYASWRFESDQMRIDSYSKVESSDPFSVNTLLKELDIGKFGSVTNDIEELLVRRRQLLSSFYQLNPDLPSVSLDVQNQVAAKIVDMATANVIDLDDDQNDNNLALAKYVPPAQQSGLVVIIDSDDDDDVMAESYRPALLGVNLQPSGNLLMKDFVESNFSQKQSSRETVAHNASEAESTKDEGMHVGTVDNMQEEEEEEEEESDGQFDANSDDGLGDIWNEMSVALEISKDAPVNGLLAEHDDPEEEDCEHSFILKDDIGYVCRICGVVGRGIETIIEYNFSKNTRNTRTYKYEGRTTRDLNQTDSILPDGLKSSDIDFNSTEIYPHPRHRKEMKPHQIEGFNFLLSNLVSDNPGGCIMAHAPGSGKTFMIISFLQSFMAKYPAARPLVVLPRGILAIWKKEFLRWQVEDIPLYDFYSVKADSRVQQLEVLKAWVKERSVLFLGYKQFSSIICGTDGGQAAVACQDYLLRVPTILILDEGHTPRNQDTDVLTSLERVETARKVVLSGTLYQNHVKEVFNILNLVRPKFLKMETPKAIRRRILSRAEITKNPTKNGKDNEFYELIERTLIKDENRTRKVTVIQDLRQMTKKVLHYYKGDNLDELPGLVDFSVFLRLSDWQKREVNYLNSLGKKFKISAQGSAIYAHPMLKSLANSDVKDRVDEEKIDAILETLKIKDGVKLKFYLNLLQLCESSGEKLLVFSQYLLPLKFLERITAKEKGYSTGKEMFVITGDADTETRETSMEKFNSSSESRVFFGSIRACGEGISLVGASRIIILDVPLNPSVTRQAIGRAFRPGQVRKVYTYRLIASGSPEEEDHTTCFKKESISKMWFEWDEFSAHQNLDMEKVDVNQCGDMFLETQRWNEDVVALYKR